MWGFAFFLLVLLPSAVNGEGSRNVWPTIDAPCTTLPNGTCRALMEWRATGEKYGIINRRTLFYVYATIGEVIHLGSTGQGLDLADIKVFTPGRITGQKGAEPINDALLSTANFSCNASNPTQGRIANRSQELAGPLPGDPNGYDPCTYDVTSTGIHHIVIVGPSGANSTLNPIVGTDLSLNPSSLTTNQTTSVAAWDITVRSNSSSTSNLDGRVFTYALSMITVANERPVFMTLYAALPDGYQYRIETQGMDPNGWVMYGNKIGFYDSDSISPLYHDIRGTGGSPQNLLVNQGGVFLAPPEFPLFFSVPDNATLSALGYALEPIPPVMNPITFFSVSGGGNNSVNGTGGIFKISGTVGVFEIIISRNGFNFDPTLPTNRVLRGVMPFNVTRNVTWNGKDNSGNFFPLGANYSVRGSVHAGEYHFPMIDVESSYLGGPTIKLINAECSTTLNGGCYAAFYDDRGYTTVAGNPVGNATHLCNNQSANAAPAIAFSDPILGFNSSSTQRSFGVMSGVTNPNTDCSAMFGDSKGLDLWTYIPSTPQTTQFDIIPPPTPNPTSAPTTRSPATRSPTHSPTRNPTTLAPTTQSPTRMPTTSPTQNPTTESPSTQNPTTMSPTTQSPTTMSPTQNPTTMSPTQNPTTERPSTQNPTTKSPSTITPTTNPSTQSPTRNPTTISPSTQGPTTLTPTASPSTHSPTRNPTTVSPSTQAPSNLSYACGNATCRGYSATSPTIVNGANGTTVIVKPDNVFNETGVVTVEVLEQNNNTASVIVRVLFLGSNGPKHVVNLIQNVVIRIPLIPVVWDRIKVCLGEEIVDKTVEPECKYYDEITQTWISAGCHRTNLTSTEIECSCSHLTDFAAVLPKYNAIQFEAVRDLTSENISAHPTGIIAILVVLLVFSIVFAFAVVRDRAEAKADLKQSKQAKWGQNHADRISGKKRTLWKELKLNFQLRHTWAGLINRKAGTSFQSMDRVCVALTTMFVSMSMSARFHGVDQSWIGRGEVIVFSVLACLLPSQVLTQLFVRTGPMGFYEEWEMTVGIRRPSKFRYLNYRFPSGWRRVWMGLALLSTLGMILYILAIALQFDRIPKYYCLGNNAGDWVLDWVLSYVLTVFVVEPLKVCAVMIVSMFRGQFNLITLRTRQSGEGLEIYGAKG